MGDPPDVSLLLRGQIQVGCHPERRISLFEDMPQPRVVTAWGNGNSPDIDIGLAIVSPVGTGTTDSHEDRVLA